MVKRRLGERGGSENSTSYRVRLRKQCFENVFLSVRANPDGGSKRPLLLAQVKVAEVCRV